MTPRQTNLALLWLTILGVVSGTFAFMVGTKSGWWVVIAHGVAGLGLLVLTPWKTPIARRGLNRSRPGRPVSVALTASALLVVATGFLVVIGLADRIGPFTLMQAHVGLGLIAVVLAVWHTIQRPAGRTTDRDRRTLIRNSGVLAGAAALYLATEGLWRVTALPADRRRFTGSHQIVGVADVPATQWLNDSVQHLEADHRVSVAGVDYLAADLAIGDLVEATLDCTGGWYTTQTWEGTRLDRLIGDVSGSSVVVRSVTGYWRRFPIEQSHDLLLATHVDGAPLRDGHGAPIRLVAPGRRGYWWVKWISTIEVDHLPSWWQPPLPLA